MFRGIELAATAAHAIIQSSASPCFRYGHRRPTARVAQNRSGGREIVIIIISRITDAIHENRRRPTAARRRRQTHGRRPYNCDYDDCRHRIRQNVRFAPVLLHSRRRRSTRQLTHQLTCAKSRAARGARQFHHTDRAFTAGTVLVEIPAR